MACAEIPNTCSGCPAAAALCADIEQLEEDTSYFADSRRSERALAVSVLGQAASEVACKDLTKELPEIPDTIPSTGSPELINLVTQCPAFSRYVELRQAMVAQTEDK